jgi:molybdenum cofactor guanylyltransferase
MSHEKTPKLTARLANVTGVALAGGRSQRMGRDKAALELAGRPLIARAVERLGQAFERVMVVGPNELETLAPGVSILPDRQPGLGPLGGLATALRHMETDWLFLVACDMPFIQPALARHIAQLALDSSDMDAVAIRPPGGWEPLHAAYHRRIAPTVARALTTAHPTMRGLLDELRTLAVASEDVARLDPRSLSTFNANTPEEWAEAQRIAAEELGG